MRKRTLFHSRKYYKKELKEVKCQITTPQANICFIFLKSKYTKHL